MAQTFVTITHDKEVAGDLQNQYQLGKDGQGRFVAACLENYLASLASGNRMGSMTVLIDAGDWVAATGTITLSSLVATDTITVGTQVFTSNASPTGNNQFLSTGGDTVVAAAAVVKINAHPSLAGVVTATSVGAVITVTAAIKGLIGNQIPIAISAHGTASAAKLAGGTASTLGVSKTYAFGV